MSANRPRGALGDILWHFMPNGYPTGELAAVDSIVGPDDREIAERVLRAFDRATAHERGMRPESIPNDGIWEMMKHVNHGEFYKVLFDHDVNGLAEILASFHRQPITNGLGPGNAEFAKSRDPAAAAGMTAMLIDRFMALAEAVGAIQYENPEQGIWGENIYRELTAVRAGIEKSIGASIRMPECGGVFGVRIGDAIVSKRTSENVYAAWRMSQILGQPRDIEICEIGAGMGGTAYYCFGRGVHRYTIVDLPVINALQGYLLIKTCGSANVRLLDERETGQAIRVMPYWFIEETGEKCFDLVFNQDSMPEIMRVDVENYLTQIRRTARGHFYSINQEGGATAARPGLRQIVVPEAVEAAGGYRRVLRYPYWIRRGYVEELYEIKQ